MHSLTVYDYTKRDMSMVRSWAELCTFYKEVATNIQSLQSMVTLIEKIQGSHLKSLFAWQSMHDLCISQTEVDHPDNLPYLRISPDYKGKFEFWYIDTELQSRQWHRVIEDDQAFDRLLAFTEQLGWFVKYKI